MLKWIEEAVLEVGSMMCKNREDENTRLLA